jgi:hypothetical protein
LLKYSQVRSCFEVFIVKNSMVKSKFNFDTRFVIYRFFLIFKQFGEIGFFWCFACMQVIRVLVYLFSCMHVITYSRLSLLPACKW